MPDFKLFLPDEICAALGQRARQRRIELNISLSDLAARIGVTEKTVGNFERTGRCTLETFVRILEALNATGDLQDVLFSEPRSIKDMQLRAAARPRQRASRPRQAKP